MRFAVYDPWVEIFARHDRPGPGHPANRAGTAHRLRRRTCRPWRQDAAIVRPGPRHAGIGGPSQQPVRREDNGPGSLCRGLRAGNAVAPCLGQWPRHAATARGFPQPLGPKAARPYPNPPCPPCTIWQVRLRGRMDPRFRRPAN